MCRPNPRPLNPMDPPTVRNKIYVPRRENRQYGLEKVSFPYSLLSCHEPGTMN
jgi:hypothetical protein